MKNLPRLPVRTLALLLCALLAGACSRSSDEDYLQRAKAALAQADVKSAEIELANALQIDATAAEARWLTGKLLLDIGYPQDAEAELIRAQESGWADDDIVPTLAYTLLTLGRYSDVLELDSSNLSPPSEATLLSAQSLAAMSLGDMQRAAALATEADERDPAGVDGKLARATLLTLQGDAGKSMQSLMSAVKTDPDNPRAWQLLGLVLLDRNQHNEARAAFDKAIELQPLWIDPRVNRALHSLRMNDFDSARSDAELMMQSSPGNPAVNYVQGLLHMQAGEYRGAIDTLSRALPLAQNYPLISYSLGKAYLLSGQESEALTFADAYHKAFPNNVEARKLLAALEIRREDYAHAQALLEPILDQNPTELEALSMSAVALAHQGEAERALSLYSWIARMPDSNPVPKVPRNSELVAAALADHTAEEKAGSSQENTHPEDDLLTVLRFLQNKDYEAAMATARDMQLSDTTDLSGHHILAKVYLAAGRESDATKILRSALESEPSDPVSNLMLADLARAAGKSGQERFYYQQILNQHAYHLPTLLRFAKLELNEANEAAFLSRMAQAMRAHPTALAPRIELALFYLGKGKPYEIEELFEPLSELQRRAPRLFSLELLASMAEGKRALTQAQVDTLLTAQPGSEAFYYTLVDAAARNGRLREVRSAMLASSRSNPNHMGSLVGLARAAQQAGDVDQLAAYSRLLEQIHPRPESPLILRLRAAAAAGGKDYDEAIELTKQALTQLPRAELVLDLSNYRMQSGAYDKATEDLTNWLQEHPDELPVKLALAQLLEAQGKQPRARILYRQVIDADPENFAALNNLAWSLRHDRPKQALNLAERAQRSAPDHAGVLDTLAVIQHLNGEHTAALSTVHKALKLQPENPNLRYHRAMILAALERQDEAIDVLRQLTGPGAKGFSERDEAEQLLQSLQP